MMNVPVDLGIFELGEGVVLTSGVKKSKAPEKRDSGKGSARLFASSLPPSAGTAAPAMTMAGPSGPMLAGPSGPMLAGPSGPMLPQR